MDVTRNYVSLVLLLFLLPLSQGASVGSDVFNAGTNFTDGSTLVSAGDGTFTLGFFSPGVSTKRYLGTWFTVSSSAVCWVANRDRLLDDEAGVLVLSDTGSLLLVDGSGQTIWTSNSTTTRTFPAVAQLLESGNLVIHEGTADTIVWQSFDFLSDTLLPGMKMGRNLWAGGTEWYLSSWRSADDPSPAYRLVTEVRGLPELVLMDLNSRPIYSTGPWNGLHFSGITEAATYSSIYKLHVTVNSGEVTFGYTAIPGAPLSRLVVTSAGMVKRLVWEPSTQQWNAFYRGPRDVCDDYAMCGPFGLCNANAASTSFCGCPRGFTPASPSDWILRENSGGCRRSLPLNCAQGNASSNNTTTTTDGFMLLQGVKLPDTYNATVDMSINPEACKARCSANCSCVAYAPADISVGAGTGCVMWASIIGLRYVDGGQDLYLRLPISELGEEEHLRFPTVWVTVGAAIGLLVVVALIIAFFEIKRRQQGPRISDHRGPDAYSRPHPTSTGRPIPELGLATIRQGTGNFSEANVIGRGGFSIIFKADLPNGTEVAVKRLKQHRLNDKGKKDFSREVEVMSRFEHVNLVKLLYRCQEQHEWILVYEFMQNRSLDLHIFATRGPFEQRRSSLNWAKRVGIIHGIATGIKCLHDEGVTHRDLKPDNILLDDTFNPKIADFATAKPLIDNQTTVTLVKTAGYVAPEYIDEGTLTSKCDVFSFGVILLEIVGGKRRREMPTTFLSDVWQIWHQSETRELLDPQVGEPEEDLLSVLCRSVQIGLLCVQHAPEQRPAMSEVLAMLTNTDSELLVPAKPTPNSGAEAGAGSSALEISDVTDARRRTY